MRRALVGNERPVFHKGEVVGYVREPSDVLAMFILKSRRREIYGERKDVTQTTVSSIAAMTVEERLKLADEVLEQLKVIAAPVLERRRRQAQLGAPVIDVEGENLPDATGPPP